MFEFRPELVDDDDAEADDTKYEDESDEDGAEEVMVDLTVFSRGVWTETQSTIHKKIQTELLGCFPFANVTQKQQRLLNVWGIDCLHIWDCDGLANEAGCFNSHTKGLFSSVSAASSECGHFMTCVSLACFVH